MRMWYWMDNGQRKGPVTSQELKSMADAGRITEVTMIAKEGSTSWTAASKVKGLFEQPRQPVEPPPDPRPSGRRASTDGAFDKARDHAASLIRDLRAVNWKEEIIPVDGTNIQLLLHDYVFWSVILLGIVPELIGTIKNADFQLTAYLFFFAAMWGVVFRDFIVRAPVKWKWLLISAVFTGLIGTNGLLFVDSLLPAAYANSPNSPDILKSLTGYVLMTGLTEELCKAIPAITYLLWKRKHADPWTVILIGVFSGLGFAAIENVRYANDSVLTPLLGLQQHNAKAYVAGVQSVISEALLRSLSDVFGHAVLSGIVAYFMVMAVLTSRRAPMLAFVGLALSAVLHGFYNWLSGLQPTFASILDGGTFLLFYGYISKLRNLIAEAIPAAGTAGVAKNGSCIESSAVNARARL